MRCPITEINCPGCSSYCRELHFRKYPYKETEPMTLKQYIHQSCTRQNRSLFDIIRTIAVFIPEEHELASIILSCIQSMEHSPPEAHQFHFLVFLREFDGFYNEAAIPTAPWWVQVIGLIILAGSPVGNILTDRLNQLKEPSSI